MKIVTNSKLFGWPLQTIMCMLMSWITPRFKITVLCSVTPLLEEAQTICLLYSVLCLQLIHVMLSYSIILAYQSHGRGDYIGQRMHYQLFLFSHLTTNNRENTLNTIHLFPMWADNSLHDQSNASIKHDFIVIHFGIQDYLFLYHVLSQT